MRRVLFPLLLAASIAIAQDDFDRVLLLARTRQQMTQSLLHLPDYTCVATAHRSVQKPGHADFKVVDTLRYEIAHAGVSELWSWPGASKFEDKPVVAMIGSGAISQGEFSSHARSVFMGGYANAKFEGAEDPAGRQPLPSGYNHPI